MSDDRADINARIERAERTAIGKSMSGQWTKADDEALAALYDERRRNYQRGIDDE